LKTPKIDSLREHAEQKNQESIRLVKLIAERIENQELDCLQELVNRAVELRSNDEELLNLQRQQTQMVGQRDLLYGEAQQLFKQGKAQEARIALRKVPKVETKAYQREFKEKLESVVEKELRIVAAVKEANADGVLGPVEVVNLLQMMNSYLELNPNHEKIRLRCKQLIDRVVKTPLAYRDLFVTMPSELLFQLPPVVNSVGMAFKLIPAGTFQLGEGDESHGVTLTRPYYLGVYEVTQDEYQRVMGTNPSNFKGAKLPVEQVSWDDAVSFCKKLSDLPEERQAGRVYRLPTEAEWEYACRAGTTKTYSFGDSEGMLGDHAWYDTNSDKKTHPVGGKKPNSWGLYDMHGNVWEWCQDWYGSYPSGLVTDPKGLSIGSHRVLRGGSWVNLARHCRSARRSFHAPSDRDSNLGFRVVKGLSSCE